MTKKKKWLLGIGGGLLLLFAWIVLLSPWVWPGGGIDSLVISKETTWLTDPPMKPNGLVNYVKYIVDRSTEGVTPENNAMACFVRALGPVLIEDLNGSDGVDRELVKERLGIGLDEWEGPFLGDIEGVLAEYVPVADTHENEGTDASSGRRRSEDSSWADSEFLSEEDIDTSEIEKRLSEAPWTAAEYPKVKQWLDENAAPLEWIVKGSQRERYSHWVLFRSDNPNSDYMVNLMFPGCSLLRGASRALAIRSMYKMGEGDISGAWSDTMVIRRMARLVSQDSCLIPQLVCYAIDSLGLEAQQFILRSKTLTVAQARGMLRDIQSLSMIPSLERSMEGELFMLLDTAMMLVAMSSEHQVEDVSMGDSVEFQLYQTAGHVVDINQMLRTLNAAWRPVVDRASLPTMLQRKSATVTNSEMLEERPFQKLTPGLVIKLLLGGPSTRRRIVTDVITDFIIVMMMPSLERAHALRDTAVTKSLLIETMAALAVYRAEKGEWPAALGDLVPAILPAVPADPWSKENAPLIYKRTPDGFLLYSLGYNEMDDGGEFNDEIEEGDVLVSDPKREEDDEESDR